MGLISSTHSICRYHIEGEVQSSIIDVVKNGLIQNKIPDVQSEYEVVSAGWVPFESPYNPDFEKFGFEFGTNFVFSLRIDKKTIPPSLIQKHMAIELEKAKLNFNTIFISKNHKAEIKQKVIDDLIKKIVFIPYLYDVLWDYENKNLYLFTTQKKVNEFFVTLFLKSFDLKPFRIFPYTLIEKKLRFSNSHKDKIYSLAPLKYVRENHA